MNMAKEYWNESYWKSNNRSIARELILHAFIHDLSKFSSKEFTAYAKFFHGEFGNSFQKEYSKEMITKMKETNSWIYFQYKTCSDNFNKAWEHHYKVNKHHPEHWVGKDMPMKHIRFMVCDLKAMSRKFGGTAQEYYLKNYYKWEINRDTRYSLEIQLDLIKEYNAPICECSTEYYMTIEELIEDFEKYLKEHGEIYKDSVEECLNDLLKPACDRYNLNIYKLVKSSEEYKKVK
jgi:hypothetical protein